MAEAEPELIYSPLCRKLRRQGLTFKVSIYRGEDEDAWLLELEAPTGGSTVWDDRFTSDADALNEAVEALDRDGVAEFLV